MSALDRTVAFLDEGFLTEKVGNDLDARRQFLGSLAKALANRERQLVDELLLGRIVPSEAMNSGDSLVLPGLGAVVLPEHIAVGELLPHRQLTAVINEKRTLIALPTAAVDPTQASWHIKHIGTPSTRSQAGEGVLIGMLDAGIDCGHSEFLYRPAYRVFREDGTWSDQQQPDVDGHGTHMAGLIAGQTVGVAPAAALAVAAVWPKPGPHGAEGSVLQMCMGLEWLTTTEFRPGIKGVDLINISGGALDCDVGLRWSINAALRKKILAIAAVGNRARNLPDWPAAYPEVVSVGATDARDKVASFSSWGHHCPQLHGRPVPTLSAPGIAMYSALPGAAFGWKSGTSCASAIVSGVAAVRIWNNQSLRRDPKLLRADLVKNLIGVKTGDWGNEGGDGRIVYMP